MTEQQLIQIIKSLIDYASDKDVVELAVGEFEKVTGCEFSPEIVYELSGITVRPEGGNIFSMISAFETVHYNGDIGIFTYSVNSEMYALSSYDIII